MNRALVLPDDAINHAQTQSNPFSKALCRKKWFKRSLPGISTHAAAGIANSQLNTSPRPARQFFGLRAGDLRHFCFNPESAPVRHGIARIDSQFHNCAVQLIRVDPDIADIRPERRLDSDTRAEDTNQPNHHVGQQVIDG
jgi:hypothetical protein